MLRTVVFVFVICVPLQLQAETLNQGDFSSMLKSRIRMVQHLALNPVLIRVLKGVDVAAEPEEVTEITEDAPALAGETVDARKDQLPDHLLVMKRFIDRNPSFTDIWLTGGDEKELISYRSGKEAVDTESFEQALSQGASHVFVGALKRDERTNAISTYVSAPVLDRGDALGVLVVGIRLGGSSSRAVN